jgi:hypothetical protein
MARGAGRGRGRVGGGREGKGGGREGKGGGEGEMMSERENSPGVVPI